MPASTQLACAITLALAATAGTASAAQLEYSLYTGIEHSDNIGLTPTHPVSQNMLVPGLNFTLAQQGSVLQANVAGNLEYRDYLGSRYSNQTQLQLAGQVNWTVLPERLDFIVQDFAGVQPVDRLASNAPSNQQQTNVLALGPTLHFRLGDTLLGQAELRYIDSYAQKSKDFNSRRGVAALRVLKNLNPTDQLSANIETQHVDFAKDAGITNYDRNELYGRYLSKLANINIDVTLGWTQLEPQQRGARTTSSPLARATLNWAPTQRSSFTFAATREYSDAALDMMQQPNATIGDGINIGDTAISPQVYLDRRAELTYAFSSERLTLSIAPLYRKLSYLDDPTLDQTGHGGSISIDYRLRPTLTVSAFVGGEKLVYNNLVRTDKTFSYGVNLAQQWTQHWGWRAALTHQQRNSNMTDQSFRENRIYFGVVFKR